jgi:CBS domain-containing protein
VLVSELCIRKVEVSEPRESVADAGRRMQEAGVGTLVVVDSLSRPIGIVTDRDLLLRCLAAKKDPLRTPLEQVMSGPVAWIHEGSSVEEALEEMARLRVRRLAVVDDRERLVGVLALDDALCRELGEDTVLGRALRANL